MSAETAIQDSQSPDVPSPASNGSISGSGTTGDEKTKASANDSQTVAEKPQFPPPKTDKPRPHVCSNCGRAFARLEHLKRHERSHTKEKPFECPECTRCFARRDLLLRHQQKLHYQQSNTRPRNARRESVSGTTTSGAGRVRKNSVANNAGVSTGGAGATTSSRPRANTLGHLDLASLGLVDGFPGAASRVNLMGPNGQQHRMSMSELGRPNLGHQNVTSPLAHDVGFHNLPKLETHHLSSNIEGSLRTAPPLAGYEGYPYDLLFGDLNSSTVNPAQLHFGGSTESPASTFAGFPPLDGSISAGENQADDFSWMQNWENALLTPVLTNDSAVDESSPSIMHSAHSQGHFPDMSMDMSFSSTGQLPWSLNDLGVQPLMTPAAFHLDSLSSGLPNLDMPLDTMSPQNLHDSPLNDTYFNPNILQNGAHDMSGSGFIPPAPVSNFSSDSPSMSSSMNGSARQSSVTSVSTDSITDATRQALLTSLAQPTSFGLNHRKYSQPTVSSPLSTGGALLRHAPSLPCTADLQRYVNAYINYFHPHLPFLHIPTLSFESPDFMTNLRSASTQTTLHQSGIVGGGGCLILAMAAIGALYEYDHQASKELFDAAKRMLSLYLEERRKADMSAAVNGSFVGSTSSKHNTPLWLVQAMLLNVIYGHHCGDKRAAEIASTHCAALVALARAAKLAEPFRDNGAAQDYELREGSEDIKMQDGHSPFGDGAQQQPQSAAHLAWCKWKDAEERKRTLFTIFILSSLLVTAYNQSPAIMNSEILLDLPCDEELWATGSVSEWLARGGNQAAQNDSLPFATALSTLLTANQKLTNGYGANGHCQQPNGTYTGNGIHESELRPSTFGCLVLINALHNYIWETRTRHRGRQWTVQETEAMFAHIEPALNAWQRAWKANDHHNLQRPNPFNGGPLSADSIPLLDLAFVRLFVNLGRSKEAFWQRDFDAMAMELARGTEIGQHADSNPSSSSEMNSSDAASASPNGVGSSPSINGSSKPMRRQSQMLTTGQGSKRERHLRKAAFYAADSLTISCKFALTYADGQSHQLPIQSAMCFFDCGQVLAEWASTVQERVGRYLGVLGRDDIDYTQVPAIMLLEAEDIDLLNKVDLICSMMEAKMVQQVNSYARELNNFDPYSAVGQAPATIDRMPGLSDSGMGSKILKVISMMLEKDGTWPVTHLMANALQVHAGHMDQRAEASLVASE